MPLSDEEVSALHNVTPLNIEEVEALVTRPHVDPAQDLVFFKKRLWQTEQAMIELIDRVKEQDGIIDSLSTQVCELDSRIQLKAAVISESAYLLKQHDAAIEDHDARINWLET
jgi:septal ring factor EnvC (AmiA/AmiB activator)